MALLSNLSQMPRPACPGEPSKDNSSPKQKKKSVPYSCTPRKVKKTGMKPKKTGGKLMKAAAKTLKRK